MKVRDVMSVRTVWVTPDTPLKGIALLLVHNRISGVPVVTHGGQLVGIVSESDLQPGGPDFGKAYRTAADVMSCPVVTLYEDDSVTAAARVLLQHAVKRAPVLRDGRIVGIVTRSDLLRAYLRTDSEIRADVEQAVYGPSLDIRRDQIQVGVSLGVVRLEGWARDEMERELVGKLVGAVDGVIDVANTLEVA